MPIERRWITAAEASEYLRINKTSLYRACSRRQIPFTKVKGIGLRIDKRGLDAQLEREGNRPGDSGKA
jgi:excisionase family DNA binding protein